MARRRTDAAAPPDRLDAILELMLGPVYLTEAELRGAWQRWEPEVEEWRSEPSWGWWAFESGAG
jgi:hypothetical protein